MTVCDLHRDSVAARQWQRELASRCKIPVSLLAILIWCFTSTPRTNAQAPQAADEGSVIQMLPSSERVSRSVRKVRQLIRDEQFDQAARTIGKLAAAEAGNLAPGIQEHQFLPLHRVLAQELAQLPPAQRDALQAMGRTLSRAAVASAIQTGRWNDLTIVMQRHPGSPDARTAQLVLARLHLDRGNWTAARHWLAVASESDLSNAQRLSIQQLTDRIPAVVAEPSLSADRVIPVSVPQWRVRWHQQEHIGDRLHSTIDRIQTFASGNWTTPWNAIVRQGIVVRRTLQGLAALDLSTGQTKWVRRLASNHLDLLHGRSGANQDSANAYTGDQLRRMLLHDGALSRVRAGDHSAYAIVAGSPATQIRMQQGQTPVASQAELIAVSLTDGRRRWTVGGPELEPKFKSELSDSWFAGPPVTDGHHLHLIAEHQNEIRLVTLNEATGESLDSLLLAFPESPVHRDPGRRLLAAPPVVHEGILLCSTTTGWLIAVDQLTRTVLWASRTDTAAAPKRAVPRFNRGSIVDRAIRNLSPVTQTLVFDSQVVVAPRNSRSLVFLDLITGQRQQRLLPRNRLNIVAGVKRGLIIVTGDGLTLERMDPFTRESQWKTRLDDGVGTLAGPGIVFQDELTVASTGGVLVTVDTNTGAILATTANILPKACPGTLVSVPAQSDNGERQLLYVAPDETFCLTTGLEAPPSSGIVEQVTQLKQAGNLEAAWSVLAQSLPAEIESNERLQDLQFEVALQLDIQIRREGGDASVRLIPDRIAPQDLATKPEHKQLLRIARVAETIKSEPSQAALEAIEIAEHPPAGRVMLPSTWLRTGSDSEPQQTSQARVSLTTWAAHVAETAIADVSQEELTELLRRLRNVSTELLVQIHQPALADVAGERLQTTTDGEQSLRLAIWLSLLQQQVDSSVASPVDSPLLTDTAAWSKLLTAAQDASDPQARQQALHQLLATVEAETTDEMDHAAFRMDGLPSWTEREDIRRQWNDSWHQTGFNVLPFARSGPSRQHAVRLQCREPLDSICNAFDFVLRRNPNRLSVYYKSPDPALLWSINRQLPGTSSSTGAARIQRFGSLLLFTAANHIVVLSMIDQRVLWERSNIGGSKRDSRTVAGRSPGRNRWPRQTHGGKPYDWLCLVGDSSLSVVDAYSGFTRWSHPIRSEQRVAITESAILITDGESVTALSPRFGFPLSTHLQPKDVLAAVDCCGAELFVAESSEPSAALQCSWKNPLSGEISLLEELSGVAHVQRPSSDQLAVVHGNLDVSVVDIATRQVQQYPWYQRSNDGAEDSAPSEWKPGQLQYYQDEDFVYLFRKPDHRMTRGRIPNRTLAGFDRIRVLDRQTGEQLWELAMPENESARAVTDQLSLPFLAVIQEAVHPVSGKRLGYVQFRCYHKRTGQLLVDSRLPSRFSYDQMRVEAEDDHSIMLQLHGTQVRFERPDSPSITRPVSNPPVATGSE